MKADLVKLNVEILERLERLTVPRLRLKVVAPDAMEVEFPAGEDLAARKLLEAEAVVRVAKLLVAAVEGADLLATDGERLQVGRCATKEEVARAWREHLDTLTAMAQALGLEPSAHHAEILKAFLAAVESSGVRRNQEALQAIGAALGVYGDSQAIVAKAEHLGEVVKRLTAAEARAAAIGGVAAALGVPVEDPAAIVDRAKRVVEALDLERGIVKNLQGTVAGVAQALNLDEDEDPVEGATRRWDELQEAEEEETIQATLVEEAKKAVGHFHALAKRLGWGETLGRPGAERSLVETLEAQVTTLTGLREVLTKKGLVTSPEGLDRLLPDSNHVARPGDIIRKDEVEDFGRKVRACLGLIPATPDDHVLKDLNLAVGKANLANKPDALGQKALDELADALGVTGPAFWTDLLAKVRDLKKAVAEPKEWRPGKPFLEEAAGYLPGAQPTAASIMSHLSMVHEKLRRIGVDVKKAGDEAPVEFEEEAED